jgi:uncharacterized protein (TIGR00297 family)
LVIRALFGAAAAGGITAAARKSNTLSESGQWAAFFCGIAICAAGWWWAAMLVAFFVTSSALTKWRGPLKSALTIGTLPRAQDRNATQVIANGGVFVALALYYHHSRDERVAIAAVGALAAASADTWSTEIGTAVGGAPLLITSRKPVEHGLSGGVTRMGFLGGLGGALFIAVLGAFVLPERRLNTIMAATIGGFTGCVADSLIGATIQAKRFCDRCRHWTERRVHACGFRTRHAHGIPWMSNDAVNAAGTFIGAMAAIGAAIALR